MAISQVVEKSMELNKTLYMAFRNHEKVFDSVDTTAVMKAIERPGSKGDLHRVLGEHILRMYGHDNPP